MDTKMFFLWNLVAAILLLSLLQASALEAERDCPAGRFGPSCQYACHCNGTLSCDPGTGSCAPHGCARGYAGDGCQNVNLAVTANASSEQLVDSDPSTCIPALLGPSAHRLDLQATVWLRRFRIVINDTFKDNRSLVLHVTNSSEAALDMMTSTNVSIRWSDDGEVDAFLTSAIKARYVLVQARNVMLCEICVLGGRNVALFRPTAQSSTLSELTSSLAVDGVTSSEFDVSSCSHTRKSSRVVELFKEKEVWWLVNLTAVHVVTRIVVHNRHHYPERLRFFHLKASASGDSRTLQTIYRSQESVPPSAVAVIPASPLLLQLLQVQLYGKRRLLTLCEVQVYGDCPDMTYGPSCNYSCDCADPQEVCDSFSGRCFSGKAKGEKTPSPIEDKGDGDDDDDKKEDEEPSLNIPVAAGGVVAVVIVILISAVIALVVILLRRRARESQQTYNDNQSPSGSPHPVHVIDNKTYDDGTYEEIESPRGYGSVNNATTATRTTTGLSAFKTRLQNVFFSASSTKRGKQVKAAVDFKQGKKGNKGNEERPAATVDYLDSMVSESGEYQEATSSGGACAKAAEEGRGGGNLYEPLGERDYESPYTAFRSKPFTK